MADEMGSVHPLHMLRTHHRASHARTHPPARPTCPPFQADLSKTDKLGNVEESVIAKYAAAEGEEEEGSDEE